MEPTIIQQLEELNYQFIQLNYALNTLYILVSGALVLWMGTGFTLLEAGLVRTKNTLDILIKNLTLYAIACLMYLLIGYDLMFNHPVGGFFSLPTQFFSILTMTKETDPSYGNIPLGAFFFFQVVFVANAMSIVSGAVAERMKLWPFLWFTVVMTAFIYPVQAYWNWGGGFLNKMGFEDFAGAGTVHLAGATAALTGVLLLGPRRGKYGPTGLVLNAFPGANLPLAVLGTLILWFGWLGFNGGSQLVLSSVNDANTVAIIFVNTNMAAAGGLMTATIISRFLFGKVDITMTLNGTLAGLVAITAGPHTPTPLIATVIGAVGGILVLFAILTFEKFKIDDPVGAISVHGVVGIWGLLAVPLTAHETSFLNQIIGLAVIFSWVFTTSFITWFLIKVTLGLRALEEDEYEGLDITECGMEAYPEFVNKYS